jgi:Carboxypeptidase regulatory-like domain/TonB-dependent Receptor Plug Domain/TonB dependent receptor
LNTKFFLRCKPSLSIADAFLRGCIIVALCASLSIAVQAQSYTGSITGIVTDPNSAVIANANVSLTSVETGLTRSAISNGEGEYIFTSLPPGSYTLRISVEGFSAREIRVQLSVSQQLRLDAQLKVGGTVETLDVIAGEGGVAVETQNSQLSNVVTERQVKDLPLISRNPYDLVALSAGATDGPDKGSGFERGSGFAINGQRSQSGNFILDGGENNDTFSALPGQTVPLDAIQEFRVQTNNYTAEYGRGSGFVANVITKSGTNEFHGTVYEFNRNSALAANDSFHNANNIEKPFFNRNQFGVSGGGPVIKNKTFFFGSAEWLRIRSSVDTPFFVPTPQLLAASSSATNSIFSQSPAPAITGTEFITAGELGLDGLTSATGAPIAASTPLFGQVTIPIPRDAGADLPQNTFLWTGRVDHAFSDRTSLFGRYAYERSDGLVGTNSFSPYDGFSTGVNERNQNLTLQLTRTWSPRVVTESRFVYNRLRENQPLGAAPVSPTFSITDVIASQTNGDIVLPGYFATASTLAAAIPFGGPQNLYQGFSTLSWQLNNHTLKFGGQYIHIRDNRTFGAFQNALADFTSVQDFIRGNVRNYQIAVDPGGRFPGEALDAPFTAPSFTRHYRYNEVAWFAEDTYKITPRLTLNAGLRWEYFGVLHSPGQERALDANFYYGEGSNLIEQTANGRFDLTINQTGDLKNRLYRPDYNNFAPRIGLAYDLFGDNKTVLRAGYGIFYDRNFGNVLFNVIQNPPNYAVLVTGDANGPDTITANVDQYAALASLSGQSYASSARALDQNMRTAYANVWNVNLQHELKNNFVVTMAYAGSNGIKLYSLNNVNRIGSGVLLGREGRLNPNISSINIRSNDGHSNYNSFQASVDSRYIKSAGLQFRAAYTWSHAIDNASSTFGDSYLLSRVGAGVFGSQDAFNPAADKGDADFDVRHRFVTSFNWDIPFAKNLNNGILKTAFNGWAMNGVLSFRTGIPFTVFDTGQDDNVGQQTIRPRVTGAVPGKLSSLMPSPDRGGTFDYIDLTGLSSTPSVNGPFDGTLGRNTFRAPGFQTWNVSFFRNINITESKKLQFRAEFFNLFNHANLFVAGGTNDISGGNTAVQVTRGGLFDNINNAEQHRNIQLALKFIF